MNKLRLEIRKLLEDGETLLRPPALRRSLRGDMLYATDLPCVADAEQTARFRRRAEEAGWRTESAEGWILLDRIPEFPPAGGFRGPFGPEAQCCASLLRRHPDRETAKRRYCTELYRKSQVQRQCQDLTTIPAGLAAASDCKPE